VHFKVGRRALADYVDKHGITQELAARFTTGVSEVPARVDKLVAENQLQKKTIKTFSQKLAAFEQTELLAAAETVGDVRMIVRVVDGDGGYARLLAAALKSQPRTIAILGAGDGAVVCSASDDVTMDIATGAVARATEIGASGGGKGTFAQLKLPADVDVDDFIKQVGNDVKISI
jgi:alanyl-tRNA synthetase